MKRHVILLNMSINLARLTLDQLQANWPEYHNSFEAPHPFVTPDWLGAWWESFGAGEELFLGVIADDVGAMGIVPLRVKEGIARFIGSANVCDYLDFPVREGAEMEFFGTLLNELKVAGVKTFELESLRPDSAVIKHLIPLARSRGDNVEIADADFTVEMSLPPTWDGYLSTLATHQRHETGRKLRRLEEAGATGFDIKPPQDVEKELSTLIHLLRISRSDKAEFMTDQMETYFKHLATAMQHAGLLRFGNLHVGETVVASIMCFDYNDTRYLYNSGYDPQYSSLSVGLLSKVYSIKDAIGNKMNRYDFLKGAETYKYHLGGSEMSISRARIELI